MKRSFLLSLGLVVLRATAQNASPYTDKFSDIKFNGYIHPSGFTIGIAVPGNYTTDFIAQFVAPVTNDGGWAGFTMGAAMVDTLAVVAWPHEGKIISSFRKATAYTSPKSATGNFTMTPIPRGTYVNDTAFSYTFLCSNCIGEDALVLSNETSLGWAFSDKAVTMPASASSALTYHTAGLGTFSVNIADAKSKQYGSWAKLAISGSTGTSTIYNPTGNAAEPVTGGDATSGAAPKKNVTATTSNSTYDYIVCGAGPSGIIVAQRLSESGKSVLLVEGGGPSFASTGNNDTLSWNSTMTMYDVPALGYYLGKVGEPSYCTDTASIAGCLLGGGTAVNAMMFVKPSARDFDDKWPSGWRWKDVSESAGRLYERNPGQNYGSIDGLRYNNEAYGVLSQFLGNQGWEEMDMINGDCNSKKDVFSYPPLNTANGLRDGPVRSYLPLAQNQKDFKLMLRTKVIRAVRHGPVISGVETETSTGDRIIYNVKAGGSVVFAGGALSTPRLLFNSGIGPTEQLQFVASGTTGVTLPAKSDWIILPVGAEVKDHTIFTVKFKTNSTMYSPPLNDTLKPNQTSIDLFAKGSGLLSQSGQRLTFWTSVNTTCGTEVFIQGTCNGPANNTIQMKIYLTHGLTSVGSLGITPDGATEFITNPWMNTKDDSEAITIFMDRLLKMTQASGSTLSFLSAGNVTASSNITGADLTKEHVTGSHYVGTAKMGTKGDPGVVVDTDTKVYGTDNLFVVDASIHPDLPIGNTQAIVMVAAEKAAERILACGRPPASQTHASSTDPSVGTSISHPVPNGTNPSLAPTSVSPNAPAQPPTQTSRPYQNDQLSQFTHTSSKALTAPAQSLSQTSRPYENAQPTQYAQGPDKADDYNHRP